MSERGALRTVHVSLGHMKVASGVAFLAMVVLLSAGCTGDPEARFGPAAVVPDGDGSDMEAGISGTLSISAECVLLETPGQDDVLLVFREGQVSWDAEAEELQIEDGGRTETFVDGSHVEFGGGGSSASEEGGSSANYVAGREWVNPPSEACWRNARFDVHSLGG